MISELRGHGLMLEIVWVAVLDGFLEFYGDFLEFYGDFLGFDSSFLEFCGAVLPVWSVEPVGCSVGRVA